MGMPQFKSALASTGQGEGGPAHMGLGHTFPSFLVGPKGDSPLDLTSPD